MALLAAGTAAAQEPGRHADAQERLVALLVAEPPTGFVSATRGATPADPSELAGFAVGYERSFDSEPGELRASITLSLWDPTVTPVGTEFALGVLRAARGELQPFDATVVHPGAVGWQADDTVDEESWVGHAVALRHGGLIVEAQHWAPSGYPLAAVESQLRDLVNRQLARPSVPAPAVDVPREAAYLDELLLDEPGLAPSGEPFILLPALSGSITEEHGRRWGIDQDVAAILGQLEGRARGLRRYWAEPGNGTELVVAVVDLGSGTQAGVALRTAARRGTPLDKKSDTIVLPAPQTQPGLETALVAGRQGQFVITAATTGQERRQVLLELAERALARQRALLPEGATAPVRPPSGSKLQGEFYGAVFALLGLIAAFRLLGGWWTRRRVQLRPAAGAQGAVVSVAESARHLRRTGVAMGVALLAATTVALASLLPPRWKLLLSLAGFAAILVIVLLRRRIERPERWKRVGWRRPRLFRSAFVGGGSVFVLVVAGFLALASALRSISGPSLVEADFEREYGFDLGGFDLVLVLALPLLAAFLFRLARRQARLRAEELRRFDDRPPVLYLRGFTDDRLKIPTIVSGRRPVVELLSPALRDGYESVVDWELDAAGPTVTIADPSGGLGGLGPAREYASGKDWKEYVAGRIQESRFIAVSLGRGEGVLWEVAQLAERDLLDRTLFLFPPVGAPELRARWKAVVVALGGPRVVGDLPLDPASVLVAIVEDGHPLAFTAEHRDEAGYRAAISAALARLAQGAEPRLEATARAPSV